VELAVRGAVVTEAATVKHGTCPACGTPVDLTTRVEFGATRTVAFDIAGRPHPTAPGRSSPACPKDRLDRMGAIRRDARIALRQIADSKPAHRCGDVGRTGAAAGWPRGHDALDCPIAIARIALGEM
jgi:hypothetical protein